MDQFIKVGAVAIMVGVLALVVVGVVNFLTMGHDPEHEPIGERTPSEAAQDEGEAVGGGPLESDSRDEPRNKPGENVRDDELPAEYLQQIQAGEPLGDDPFGAGEPGDDAAEAGEPGDDAFEAGEPGVDPFEAGEPTEDAFEAGEPAEGDEAFDEGEPAEGDEAFDEGEPSEGDEAFDETLPLPDEEDAVEGQLFDTPVPYYPYGTYRGEIYRDSEGSLRLHEPLFDRPRPESAPRPDRPTLRDAPRPRGPGEEFVD